MAMVLVVDDEGPVRQLASRILREGGYHVVEAADGVQAWQYFQREPSRVDVLLTDVVMPYLAGTELAARVARLSPHTPIVLMSGYTPADLTARGLGTPSYALLTKPFTSVALLQVLEDVLGNPRADALRPA
jgi:two-component system, cell cycle sensor histidine kinase and response regulator CckA